MEKGARRIPKLLITCAGPFSNLSSSIALAQRLKALRFDVLFAAPNSFEADIQYAGFDVFAIEAPKLSIRATYLPPVGKARSGANRRARATQAAAILRNTTFADVLKTVNPDVVLSDCEHHSAIIHSIAAGYPTVLLSFMYFTPPGDAAPPLTSSVVPGRGWMGTATGVRLAWTALQTRKRVSLAFASLKGWGAELASAHQELARMLGVDLNAVTTKHAFQTPWSYTLPTLLLVSGAHDLPVDPAPYQHFVGPMVLRTRRPHPHQADVARFLDDTSKTRKIYAGFGSMGHAPKAFVDRLLDVARRNPDWKILISSIDPTIRSALTTPENVALTSWAPQLNVLQVCDCAIFHGGAGTLNECLATKTPMLIFPEALDGKGNGARAVFHGTGLTGSFRDGSKQIEEKIRHLCTSSEVRDTLRSHYDLTFSTSGLEAQNEQLVKVLQDVMISSGQVSPVR